MADPTAYIVLRRVKPENATDPVVWEAIDWDVKATTAEGAIRATAAALNPADGAC